MFQQLQDEKFAVIGDVHGLSKELRQLVADIKAKYGDIPIFCTGDLIDRGPDSYGVVEACLELDIQPVLGNHDEWLQQCINEDFFSDWVLTESIGGKATVASYYLEKYGQFTHQFSRQFPQTVPDNHKQFFRNLPYYRILTLPNRPEQYLIIHSGLSYHLPSKYVSQEELPSLEIDQILDRIIAHPQGRDALLWARSNMTESGIYKFDNTFMIFGHTPVQEPLLTSHCAGVDTGGCFEDLGVLTAIVLPDKEFVQLQVV